MWLMLPSASALVRPVAVLTDAVPGGCDGGCGGDGGGGDGGGGDGGVGGEGGEGGGEGGEGGEGGGGEGEGGGGEGGGATQVGTEPQPFPENSVRVVAQVQMKFNGQVQV